MKSFTENAKKMEFTNEQKTKISEIIRKTIEQLQFFGTILDTADKTNIKTHLSLLEYAMEDLSEQTGYTFQSLEKSQKIKSHIRMLNEKVNQLEQKIGTSMNAATVSAGIRYYEEIFIAWYESIGFHYASTKITVNGICADFSYEINDECCPYLTSNEKLFEEMKQYSSSDFLPNKKSVDIDCEPGTGSLCLKDTDSNRHLICSIFDRYLPGATVRGFSSRIDHNVYLLKVQAYIPFSALEKLKNSLSNT